MMSRLRMIFLGLGILSTVIGCALAPPSLPPPPVPALPVTPSPVAPTAVAPPATSPPAVVPPAVAPSPYPTGTRGSDTYQASPYEREIDREVGQYRQRRSQQEQAQE